MTYYYKATEPDATSFHDSKTHWAVGETVTIPEAERRRDLCGPGILHVSDAPAETLVGGSWPCRLFRVKPGAFVASRDHKHGTYTVTVVEELPAWQALGPMGEQVAWLIERCKTLTANEVRQLAAAARAAAWGAARAAARAAAWGAAWETARAAAWGAARAAARAAARGAAWETAWTAGREAAWGAATLALVTWDLATPDGPYTIAQRDLLVQPWREVIGLPEGLA